MNRIYQGLALRKFYRPIGMAPKAALKQIAGGVLFLLALVATMFIWLIVGAM